MATPEPSVPSGYSVSRGGLIPKSSPSSSPTSAASSDWQQQVRDALTGAASADKVYMGGGMMTGHPTTRTVESRTLSKVDAQRSWYLMSDAERAALGTRLYRAGIVADPNNYKQVQSAWQYAVEEAAEAYAAGRQRMTPWDVIGMMAGTSGAAAGPKTTSYSSTSVNIPTKQDAAAAVRSIFQDAIGRDPTDGEIARYSSVIFGAAKANPTRTNTTTTTDASGNSTSSSTTSGGMTAAGYQEMLENKVRQDPEYGAYQAATTYMNALMDAIGAPV